jgi:hypothetical protein
MSGSSVVQQRTSRSLGLILLGMAFGIGFAVLGFLIGRSSHQVVYQTVGQSAIAHYIRGDGTDYLQMNGSPVLYIVKNSDFNPAFNADMLGSGNISLVFHPEDTTDIDVTSVNGIHLVGKAYRVIEITVFDSGQQQEYVTSDYSQHPNGYYVNNWLIGNVILGFGVVVAVLALIVPKRIFTMLSYTVVGAGVLIVLALVYVGVTIPLNLDSIKSALAEDAILFGGAALLGAIIGLGVGIVQAIRGRDFNVS